MSLNIVILEISKLLIPLGVNALASLAVVLSLNELGKYNYAKRTKSQKGGNIFSVLVKSLAPLGKTHLVVLVSILLLHYFSKEKNKKKKLKGGNCGTIFVEVSKLLAPLGVNALGASALILLLQHIMKKKNKKDKIISGGSVLEMLASQVAPLGVNAFFSAGILFLLSNIYDKKIFGNKSGIKLSLKSLKNKLKGEVLSFSKINLSKKKRKKSKKKTKTVRK